MEKVDLVRYEQNMREQFEKMNEIGRIKAITDLDRSYIEAQVVMQETQIRFCLGIAEIANQLQSTQAVSRIAGVTLANLMESVTATMNINARLEFMSAFDLALAMHHGEVSDDIKDAFTSTGDIWTEMKKDN